MIKKKNEYKIAIVGLGYVGLPVALAFSKKFYVIGFDKDEKRINSLKKGIDFNGEFSKTFNSKIFYTSNKNHIADCNIYIITVPTPLKKNNIPDFSHLIDATKTVTTYLNKNNFIIYESTVYPGATEEICLPIIEKRTGFSCNKDFFIGYSPERINPGDKKNNLKNTTKIISGSNKFSTNKIRNLYKKILNKVHVVKSIKIAEAAKIIENTQRDLNIALINEYSLILKKMNIPIKDVLDAAKTKWNFLDFRPGLVGGHCVGIDPYYLAFKSKKIGIDPKLIMSGRKVNNLMVNEITRDIVNNINRIFKKHKNQLNILIMGAAFKENCSDIRNSKSIEVINTLCKRNHKYNIDLYDPLISSKKNYFNKKKLFKFINICQKEYYDVIIILVPHKFFIKMGLKNIISFGKKNAIIYDFKSVFDSQKVICY